ncbi:hypothetical protein TNCV_47181 [Trichonephila clavipes]|nr:hypothetical protein TNCV_47181 [Trichonephila clavipes]
MSSDRSLPEINLGVQGGIQGGSHKGMDVSSGKEVEFSLEMDSRLQWKSAHPFCSIQGSSFVTNIYILLCLYCMSQLIYFSSFVCIPV